MVGGQVLDFSQIGSPAGLAEGLNQIHLKLANAGRIAAVGQQQIALILAQQRKLFRLTPAADYSRLKPEYSKLLEVC